MAAMNAGSGTATSTYTFSSQPKAVTSRRAKYRDPAAENPDGTRYRDLKETCITWDKRVFRGNTYSTQTATWDAGTHGPPTRKPLSPEGASGGAARRRPRAKEKSPFDMGLPEPERIPVDLTPHLVAKTVVVEVDTVDCQTDEFMSEPPVEHYQPQKTGVDVHTQVEDGELFNFDFEVEPLLDVIVNKTLEQALMEVDEEHELAAMQDFKVEWYERQEVLSRDWEKQVNEEWERWHAKEVIVQRQREVKRREAEVLLKIQAMSAASSHLTRLVPNTMGVLTEVAFPDARSMAIDRLFLPQLMGKVGKELEARKQSEDLALHLVAQRVESRSSVAHSSLQAQRAHNADILRRATEEAQIRKGNIRIYVDDLSGGKVPVGPIQISSHDDIEEVQARVFEWLETNEPELARNWPFGVLLCLDKEAVLNTADIFSAKAGQISMMPKEKPPSPIPDEKEEEEGEEGQAEETG